MNLTFNLLLLNKGCQRVILVGRTERIKKYILANFKIDALTFHSTTGLLFIEWEKYLRLEKESVVAYDRLVKMLSSTLGNDVYRGILDLTTFLGRDAYIQKKYGGKDQIVSTVNDWKHL